MLEEAKYSDVKDCGTYLERNILTDTFSIQIWATHGDDYNEYEVMSVKLSVKMKAQQYCILQIIIIDAFRMNIQIVYTVDFSCLFNILDYGNYGFWFEFPFL